MGREKGKRNGMGCKARAGKEERMEVKREWERRQKEGKVISMFHLLHCYRIMHAQTCRNFSTTF